jgi:hypothetical protein
MLIEDAMNGHNLPHDEPRQTWQQMADEHAQLEILDLRNENANVLADVAIYSDMAKMLSDAIHAMTLKFRRERRRRRQLEGRQS